MTFKMFSERKLSQAGQQNQQSSGIKPSYSNTSYGFENKKNCTNKLSIKMFIKTKTMAEGLCFPNFLSFKTSVIKNLFNFMEDRCVR